ncbi:MAG: SH3 domain-containing protein [Chloroflexi bacterium]|nr:SH3 domain-containing protein [Chloroflexota bacterium]
MASQQLYQNDPRWENKIMGFGSTETIGNLGCLVTSLTMVGNHFGGNETVASFNDKMKNNNAFQGAWVKAFQISSVFPNVNYQKRIECNNQDAPLDEIDAALDAGSLAVVRVDYSPAVGIQSHWVVLHKRDGDDYQIWDPYNSPDEPPTLVGRFGFAGTAAQIVQEIIFFGEEKLTDSKTTSSKPAPKPETTSSSSQETTSDEKSETFIISPTVNGLTLRDKPRISGSNVLKYLPQSSKLLMLDDLDTASSKVGKRDNWFRVRDVEGSEGYVAAWYVTAVSDPALGSHETYQANEPSTPTKLIVKTSGSSVSLRTEPRVASSTLITYLPFGTELLVIEDGDAASKVGQDQQWLNVQTVSGRKGYIAAWFVVKA